MWGSMSSAASDASDIEAGISAEDEIKRVLGARPRPRVPHHHHRTSSRKSLRNEVHNANAVVWEPVTSRRGIVGIDESADGRRAERDARAPGEKGKSSRNDVHNADAVVWGPVW